MAEGVAVLGRPGAGGNVRPQPQQQFKLMPVPVRGLAGWNERVARWSAA